MKQKDIITILIPVVLFALAWVVFSIYHNSVASTISNSLNTSILPITPDFDIKTISKLKQREKIDPLYQIKPIESPDPTLSPLPTLAAEEIIEPTVTP